ncbi:MAG: MFS transporter [Proteobacteria bacterium]|nr:MFS transporter [Pseudomonadota bacterium]
MSKAAKVFSQPSIPTTKTANSQGFTGYQKFVVALLAFLQFTIILDFMILSPLGAMLMPALAITPSQFGLVVSVYAFSAGASGILAAGFADRFDRKRMLLFFYIGFLGGTCLCALATSYPALIFARIVTGIFGGVIGSIVFAITTDLFPFSMRGRVMGFVQTAFAASQVLGIPLGIYLSNAWGWHAPFVMIVAIGAVVGLIIFRYLKPIDGHLATKVDRNAFHHLWTTARSPRYLQGFATTALMAVGGFMLMPFGSAYSIHNLGVDINDLPHVYMVTGLCAIAAGPLVGRLSDAVGKFRMFLFGTLLTIIMVAIYTNLGVTPLPLVMLVNALLFVGITARMIPSQALMSAIPEQSSRGSYMAISASIQQMAGGVASVLAGHIVEAHVDGSIGYFNRIGYVVTLASLFTLFMMSRIHRLIPEQRRSNVSIGVGH